LIERPLRFGIIGCGVIGPTHACCIQELPGAELTAACDIVPERAQKLAQDFDCEAYTDYQAMLQRPDLDIVCVCTPSGLHAAMGITAARAGKHVIVEKPIDISLPKVDALITACRQAGVKLCAISQHRFDPAVVELKAAIDSSRLGRINFAGAYTQWYRSQAYYDSGDWRGTWELEGGGALINQSIHYIDLMQYLAGPIESLQGYTASLAHERIAVEDTAAAVVKFRSGALGVIEGMTSAYPGFCARLEIFGSKGGVVIEDDRIKEWRLQDGEAYTGSLEAGTSITGSSSHDIWHHGHRRQIADMLEAVHCNRPPQVDGMEGRKPLEIVLAVYAATRTGETQRLGEAEPVM
jgi:UDP-N-acetyl-2-amino-2-deoxyglucuronate dehydrogenase